MKLKKALLVCLIPAFVISGCGKTTTDEAENTMKQETTAEESAQDEQETESTESETSGEDADEEAEVSKELFAMDTYMTLTAYGEHAQEAVDKAAERVEALDALLSTGDTNSEIYQLNQSGEATLSIWWSGHWNCTRRQKVPLISQFIR